MKRIVLVLLAFAALVAQSQTRRGSFGLRLGAFVPTQGVTDDDLAVTPGLNFWFRSEVIGLNVGFDFLNFSGDVQLQTESDLLNGEVDFDQIGFADLTVNLLDSEFYLLGGVHFIEISGRFESLGLSDNGVGYNLGAGFGLTRTLVLQGKFFVTPDAFEAEAVNRVAGLDDRDVTGLHLTLGW